MIMKTKLYQADHPIVTRNKPVLKRAYTKDGKQVIIKFSYDRELVNQIKTIPGRRWNGQDKYWFCPVSLEAVEKLTSLGFELSTKLADWYKTLTTKIDNPNLGNPNLEIPGLRGGVLLDFQKTGISFIESRQGRAIIGDEMGLGKTIQALGWLQLHPEARPAIIICPASLKLNWAREAKKWMTADTTIQILSGSPNHKNTIDDTKNIIIINYDILKKWQEALLSTNPQTVIIDECHFCKNGKAQRTKAVKQLSKRVKHVIALSGTPIISRPVELYNAINMVDPSIFPSYWGYVHKYCGAKHTGWGWDFNGATNTDELHSTLTKTIMLRRLKKDVLKQLPAKIRSVVPLELNKAEYNRAIEELRVWVRNNPNNPATTMIEIEKLKQAAVRGKMKNAIQWIRDFIESGEKLVVFATHTETIETLMATFGTEKAVKIDGSVSQKDREIAVDRFQNNPGCRLFFGNTKAAGVGLTLTAASSTCFLELGWTPGEHDQAEDRVHRIGQTADSVNAYYLLAADTIEEDIARLLDKKRDVLSKVLDGRTVEKESLLTELLNKIL